jgi:hypothetical protein
MQVLEDKLKKLRKLRSYKEIVDAETSLENVIEDLNSIEYVYLCVFIKKTIFKINLVN